MKKLFLLLLVLLCPLLMSPVAHACSAAGPNAHIGTVIAVDNSAGTLTLLDQETGRPITLRASMRLLSMVPMTIQVHVAVTRNGNTLPVLTSLTYI
ncbi:MAG: hypothetical protein HY940_00095 [Gammaproteobacteria bacterium]|nr:hypothetical protein [Gammaproteobacteria bacterium]